MEPCGLRVKRATRCAGDLAGGRAIESQRLTAQDSRRKEDEQRNGRTCARDCISTRCR